MPKQKDLKRLVRARMKKTGEAYTAARLQILKKTEPRTNYAEVAGMSDAATAKATGRTWAEWVRVLDDARAMEKPHREIAGVVSSLGTPSWWTQMVAVGYERIRGLRARGQQRSGFYEAGKSRTFNVPLDALYAAFANARTRQRWLKTKVTVRSASPRKRMRLSWDGNAVVEVAFTARGDAKSVVTFTQRKLPTKAAADAAKTAWADHLDRLSDVLN
jgi:Activator of Hsp90 ATPase homolog 1-like protein